MDSDARENLEILEKHHMTPEQIAEAKRLAAGAQGRIQGSTGVAQSDPCQNIVSLNNPDSAYIDHGDGTVTDTRTGLMWKQCAEGMSWTGAGCTGSANIWTWQGALEHAD